MVQEEAVSAARTLTEPQENELVKGAMRTITHHLGGIIGRVFEKPPGRSGSELDASLLEKYGDSIRDYAQAYVSRKLGTVESFWDTGQRDLHWLRRGSVENVADFIEMLPRVLMWREELFGSQDPLSDSEAIRWLSENDLPEAEIFHAKILVRADSASLDAIWELTLARSKILLTELPPVEVVALEEESYPPLPLFKTSGSRVSELVTFRGEGTLKLGRMAKEIESLSGGFLNAVWLILVGVWPGRYSDAGTTCAQGRPLSLEQEYLMYAALETQMIEHKGLHDYGFYPAVRERWAALSSRLSEVLADHPRFAQFKPAQYKTSDSVRKALKRFREYFADLQTYDNTRSQVPANDMLREYRALGRATRALRELEWIE